ncbi:MAG: sulfur carrier protein ThiS [Planctomycetaceae bacterium]|nr:sulfur carrier protein ThiS [Planctomycetaceae bacterium]
MNTITLNGEARSIAPGCTIAQLLEELQINNRYCAVERNRELVPREQHQDCQLQSGDRVEIVTLVGGG